jgi:hypothetical protein
MFLLLLLVVVLLLALLRPLSLRLNITMMVH